MPAHSIFLSFSLSVRLFFVILQSTKPVIRGGAGQDIEEFQRPRQPFVRSAKGEKTFSKRYYLCSSDFATLDRITEVMQLKRLRGCIISQPFISHLVNLWGVNV